jgi:hypothetical protein
VVIAAVALGWVLLADDPPPPVATPAETALETAVEFMDALNAHDSAAMESMSAPGVVEVVTDGDIDIFRGQIEQEGVLGWTYHFTCEVAAPAASSTFVTCPYSFTNHITDVFDLEPYEGSSVTLRVEDGVVVDYSNHAFTDEWQGDGIGRFYDWLTENYPDEERAETFRYNYSDEANLDFWKEYIPLLLESEEASG